jgi:hypothetical protein
MCVAIALPASTYTATGVTGIWKHATIERCVRQHLNPAKVQVLLATVGWTLKGSGWAHGPALLRVQNGSSRSIGQAVD